MNEAAFELWSYYGILTVAVISCLLQARVVWRLVHILRIAQWSGRADRTYLARSTLLSELSPYGVHFAFFVVAGFPLLVAHWHWLAHQPRIALYLVEALAALAIPLLQLWHTFIAEHRRAAMAALLVQTGQEEHATTAQEERERVCDSSHQIHSH